MCEYLFYSHFKILFVLCLFSIVVVFALVVNYRCSKIRYLLVIAYMCILRLLHLFYFVIFSALFISYFTFVTYWTRFHCIFIFYKLYWWLFHIHNLDRIKFIFVTLYASWEAFFYHSCFEFLYSLCVSLFFYILYQPKISLYFLCYSCF